MLFFFTAWFLNFVRERLTILNFKSFAYRLKSYSLNCYNSIFFLLSIWAIAYHTWAIACNVLFNWLPNAFYAIYCIVWMRSKKLGSYLLLFFIIEIHFFHSSPIWAQGCGLVFSIRVAKAVRTSLSPRFWHSWITFSFFYGSPQQ